MLYRAYGFTPQTSEAFNDVDPDSYYAEAIQTARALGISNGYEDGGFHPTAPVSRQEALVLLQRAMSAAGWSLTAGSVSSLSAFSDGDEVADFAQSVMATMVSLGVIQGSDGELNPTSPVTRAEMAVILARCLTL